MFNFEQRIERAKQFRKMAKINANELDDASAIEVRTLYDEWAVDTAYEVGDRRYYPPTDKLYKCAQAHTSQANWTPDVVPAMWTVIDVEHAGTIDDPIPAVSGMEYVKGKYYSEDGTIYLMNREGMADGESIVLHFLPSQLVGQYFAVVE